MSCFLASETLARLVLDPSETERSRRMPIYGYARVSSFDQDLGI